MHAKYQLSKLFCVTGIRRYNSVQKLQSGQCVCAATGCVPDQPFCEILVGAAFIQQSGGSKEINMAISLIWIDIKGFPSQSQGMKLNTDGYPAKRVKQILLISYNFFWGSSFFFYFGAFGPFVGPVLGVFPLTL